jgi:hypothetical protein
MVSERITNAGLHLTSAQTHSPKTPWASSVPETLDDMVKKEGDMCRAIEDRSKKRR